MIFEIYDTSSEDSKYLTIQAWKEDGTPWICTRLKNSEIRKLKETLNEMDL